MSAPATLLAIDSSTDRLCLALQSGAHCRTVEEAGGAQASAHILPRLLALLADAGVTPARLDAIAFARGPGAFTGLRTACAVAQGLAFGAGRPVLPVDSLMLVAEDAAAHAGTAALDVWVAMDARMDEIYAGHYRRAACDWEVLEAPALYGLDALQARWQAAPPQMVAGSALQAFGDRLRTGGAALQAVEHGRAAALMRLAQQAWRRGEAVAAEQALPLYLRDKVALTTAERAQRAAERAS